MDTFYLSLNIGLWGIFDQTLFQSNTLFIWSLIVLIPLDNLNLKGIFLCKNELEHLKPKRENKEGRGSGVGVDYKTWLNIQDVSSKIGSLYKQIDSMNSYQIETRLILVNWIIWLFC